MSAGIVYPPEEDAPKHYAFFDTIGKLPHPDYHDIWGCLHYLSLVSNVFLACYNSGTFLSHLTDGSYGFNRVALPGLDMYQMYVVTPQVQGGLPYVRVSLVYKLHNFYTGGTKDCAVFLKTYFTRCESEINVTLSQVYFLQKRRGVRPLCHPMPPWICVDSMIPSPGVVDREGAKALGVHSSQAIMYRMMIATTHFFNILKEWVNVFIPLEFKLLEIPDLCGGQLLSPTSMGGFR